MCDYSLDAYESRPAEMGELYKLNLFENGSRGFVGKMKIPADADLGTFESILDTNCAVCVQDGTRLRLSGMLENIRRFYEVGPVVEVTMVRLPGGVQQHKDGVRFENGKTVHLQMLNAGITAEVLALPYQAQIDRLAESVAEGDAPIETGIVTREPALV